MGRHLKNGFAKKEEGGHELVEILSAAVPHCLGSTVHSVSQVHDLSPFSYQDYSSSDFLCPICIVSYLVHSMHRWSTEIVTEGGKGR